MKSLIPVLNLFILFSFVHAQEAKKSDEVCEKFKNNVIRLTVTLSDKNTQSGIGFVVGEQHGKLYVVTAKHVVRSGDPDVEVNEIKADFIIGISKKATLLNKSKEGMDLAALAIPKPSEDYVWETEYYNPSPKIGDHVWFIDKDWNWPIKHGIIKKPAIQGILKVEGLNVILGNSGAPLISEKGIAGMLTIDRIQSVDALDINEIRNIVEIEWHGIWGLEKNLEPPKKRIKGYCRLDDLIVTSYSIKNPFFQYLGKFINNRHSPVLVRLYDPDVPHYIHTEIEIDAGNVVYFLDKKRPIGNDWGIRIVYECVESLIYFVGDIAQIVPVTVGDDVHQEFYLKTDSFEKLFEVLQSVDEIAQKIRENPLTASDYKQKLKKLTETLPTKPQDRNVYCKTIAVVYRLYCASLLMEPASDNMYSDAIIWLQKSLELYPQFNDSIHLKKAKEFFITLLLSKKDSIEKRTLIKHKFRIAMVEATQEQVKSQVESN